jgi:hypothetical protein
VSRPPAQRHGFVGAFDRHTAVLPQTDLGGNLPPVPSAVRCVCPTSPWCDGPTGIHWLDCDRACRSCNPRRRRRAPLEHPRGEHDA